MYSILKIPTTPTPISLTELLLPVIDGKVAAGFPSPAEDFAVQRIDVFKELVFHPACTFVLRVTGDSMVGAGIFEGDLLVVDKYLRPQHGDVVVAELDGEYTCKRYYSRNGIIKLRPENPTYPDICPKEGQTLQIWGVVTSTIKRFRFA